MSWEKIIKANAFSTKKEAMEAIELWFKRIESSPRRALLSLGMEGADELINQLYHYLGGKRGKGEDWKEQIAERPANYERVFEATRLLIANNTPFSEKNLADELGQTELTADDREALKTVLESGTISEMLRNIANRGG